jgi:enamine deaminase RidA (YjgF/YER057c/UK114 family)
MAQVDQVVANALVAMEAVGAQPRDVVRSVVYVVVAGNDNPTVLADVWSRLRDSSIGSAFTSASTLLGVTRPGFTGQRVEIDLTAALP